MAISTKHPVSAPPAAPPRETSAHLLLRGWCTFLVFTALAGTGWLNALGSFGAGVLAAVTTVISAVVWIGVKPALQWRRLPWIAFAFVVWAAVPLLWAPEGAAAIWAILVVATFQAVFVAVTLTWRDIVRTLSSALKWVVAVSLVFELAVALFVGEPLRPGFVRASAASERTDVWSSGDFFGSSPLEGIVGDADVLGGLMVLALVVFGIRFSARAPRRSVLVIWALVTAFVLVRSNSVVSFIALAGVTLVLTTVLLMRTVQHAGERTRFYVLYAVAGVAGGSVVWIAFGDDLGRARGTWQQVFVHLGPWGVALLALAVLAFVWRAWFFAVDRPRYDLSADRPYSPLALLPTLLGALLLVEAVAEPGVLLLWGWMLMVMLGAKIKQAPLVGVGPAEHSIAMERGEINPLER